MYFIAILTVRSDSVRKAQSSNLYPSILIPGFPEKPKPSPGTAMPRIFLMSKLPLKFSSWNTEIACNSFISRLSIWNVVLSPSMSTHSLSKASSFAGGNFSTLFEIA